MGGVNCSYVHLTVEPEFLKKLKDHIKELQSKEK